MATLKQVTEALNAHLLAYHKRDNEILENHDLQDKLNQQMLDLVEQLDSRVKTLESARQRQIKLNTELLDDDNGWAFLKLFK